jgi:LysR family transcriptional activator of glutamate synthase operon
MKILQVQYFLLIVERGSFLAAAEKLYISQSSLSKQIIALENELGCQLFDRSKRKISLTNAGETFMKHAIGFDDIYKTLWADLEEYRAKTESFSIVAIPVIAQYGITGYIAQFKSLYPNIRFAVEEREGASILPALKAQEYDLAFIRDNYLDKDQCICIEICKDKLVVVVSINHSFANRKSIALAELSKENFIMFDKAAILHEVILEACRQVGFKPIIFYASVRIESILGLVASNIGVALMPEKLFDYYKTPEDIAIPLDEIIESNIVLTYLKKRKLPRAAKIFVSSIERMLID